MTDEAIRELEALTTASMPCDRANPEFAEHLVRAEITSVSTNVDAVRSTLAWLAIAVDRRGLARGCSHRSHA